MTIEVVEVGGLVVPGVADEVDVRGGMSDFATGPEMEMPEAIGADEAGALAADDAAGGLRKGSSLGQIVGGLVERLHVFVLV